jgi:hypothetical protein
MKAHLFLACTALGAASCSFSPGGGGGALQNVFVILMENENWSSVKGSASAPYINGTLLGAGAHAEAYFGPDAGGNTLHPSEPNYLWLEAGTNFGIVLDGAPAGDHQKTTQHLVTQLENAGLSWTSWQEDVDGGSCPVAAAAEYVPRHNPMVFFDDVTDTNSPTSPHCIERVRPYPELAAHLSAGTASRYNFITPNLCHDMHGDKGILTNNCPGTDLIALGDAWLSTEVPKILASSQYRNGGVVFILWDESEFAFSPACAASLSPSCNIGLIVLSPDLKAAGYSNSIPYDHSSTLRTMQEIFQVGPFLGGAAGSNDLSDFFRAFP